MKKKKNTVYLKKSAGFTIFELMIVLFIIILISALVFPNYHSAERKNALKRAAQKIVLDLRTAQSMAMGAKESRDFPQGVPPGGYGILFQANNLSYIFYADDGSMVYESDLDSEIREVPLEKGVKICSLFPGSFLSINFSPPDPIINFSGEASTATITLCLEEDETKTRIISINKAGMIDSGE